MQKGLKYAILEYYERFRLYTDYLIATDSQVTATGLYDILDTSLSSNHIITIYQVKEYHKSLKSNAAIAKSPTKTITTQISHIVMSMIAVFKLECLKIKHSLNHFALKAKILIKANMAAMSELRRLKYG